jgi:hypothetical protein
MQQYIDTYVFKLLFLKSETCNALGLAFFEGTRLMINALGKLLALLLGLLHLLYLNLLLVDPGLLLGHYY